MSPVLSAAFWGFFSGGALILGAAIGFYYSVPNRVAASIMAFGSGVLISALSFELMEEAFQIAGLGATATGFLLGAIAYAGANRLLANQGAKHRKRSGNQQPSEQEDSGSGAVSIATVAAIFLSNLPEGISSSIGMRKSGRSASYVFGVWITIAIACGLSSLAGYVVFDSFSPMVVAATTAVAAGAMLTMIVDTMIPEAFAETHDWTGLIAVLGFLTSFSLTELAG